MFRLLSRLVARYRRSLMKLFLPLPYAGEGWGEGVFDYGFALCFSLTLALSQGERGHA
jgi:hypothetical protein